MRLPNFLIRTAMIGAKKTMNSVSSHDAQSAADSAIPALIGS